jgi:hypothetical protein
MNIGVHLFGGEEEGEQSERVSVFWDEIAVEAKEEVAEVSIPDDPVVDKGEDPTGGRESMSGGSEISKVSQRADLPFPLDPFGNLEEEFEARPDRRGGCIEEDSSIMAESEPNLWLGEDEAEKELADPLRFALGGAKELETGGEMAEETLYPNRGAGGMGYGEDLGGELAGQSMDPVTLRGSLDPAVDDDLRRVCQGKEGFPAETKAL